MIIMAVLIIITAYLIGSINFAVILSGAFLKKDVRELGSGNAGATNVLRNAGLLPGILTFFCDVLKGFAATFAGKMVFDYIIKSSMAEWSEPIYGAYFCGLACMLGHVFPIFFQFKGGKGVAVSVGIFAVCSPISIIIGLLSFAVIVIVSKTVSLGSVIATVIVVTLSILFNDGSGHILPKAISSVCMGLIIIIKHKENIKRIIAETETKITSRRH